MSRFSDSSVCKGIIAIASLWNFSSLNSGFRRGARKSIRLVRPRGLTNAAMRAGNIQILVNCHIALSSFARGYSAVNDFRIRLVGNYIVKVKQI
jgi:hypothetical protein